MQNMRDDLANFVEVDTSKEMAINCNHNVNSLNVLMTQMHHR
jgi:hypothetical protein